MSIKNKQNWLTRQLSTNSTKGVGSNASSIPDLPTLFSNHERSNSSLAGGLPEQATKQAWAVASTPEGKSEIATESLLGLKMLQLHSGSFVGINGNLECTGVVGGSADSRSENFDPKNRLKKGSAGVHSSASVNKQANLNVNSDNNGLAFGTSPTNASSPLGQTSHELLLHIDSLTRQHSATDSIMHFGFDESEVERRNLILEWISQVISTSPQIANNFPATKNKDAASMAEVWSDLAHGTLSCVLINVLNPSICLTPMNPNKSAIGGLDNLNQFLTAARQYVAPESLPSFAPLDVVHNSAKGRFEFMRCLLFIALVSLQKGVSVQVKEEQIRKQWNAVSGRAWTDKGSTEDVSHSAFESNVALHRVLSTTSARRGTVSNEGNPGTVVVEGSRSRKPTFTSKTPSKLAESIVPAPSGSKSMDLGNQRDALATNSSLEKVSVETAEEVPNQSLIVGHEGNAPDQKPVTGSIDGAQLLSYFTKFDVSAKVQAAKIDNLSERVVSLFEALTARILEMEKRQGELLTAVLSVQRQVQQAVPATPVQLYGNLHSRAGSTIQSSFSSPKVKMASEANLESVGDKLNVIVAGPAPKVFGRLPKEVEDMNLPGKEKKRQTAIYELIDSEEGFVEDIQLMVTLHKTEYLRASIVTEEDVSKLFCNAEEVLASSRAFVVKLKEIADKTPCIESVADSLLEAAESFREPYVKYCAKYGDAMKYYKQLASREDAKQVAATIKANPASRGLTLEGFLIKPVQRICKYPLLIREILKATDVEHSSYANLQAASAKMDEVVAVVNEEIRTFENKEKLLKLQSKLEGSQLDLNNRVLILDGNLQRVYTSAMKERYVALLDDYLLILKTAVMNKQRYTLEHGINLQDLIVTDLGAKTKTFAISLTGEQQRKEPLTFMCVNQEDQLRWVETLSDAIKKHAERRRERQANNSATVRQAAGNFNYNDTESIADSTVSGSQNNSGNGDADEDQSDKLSIRTERRGNNSSGAHRLKSRPSIIHRQGSVLTNLNSYGDSSTTASLPNLDGSFTSINTNGVNGGSSTRNFLGLRRKQSQLKKNENNGSEDQNGTLRMHQHQRNGQRDNLGSAELGEDLEEDLQQDIPGQVELQGQIWKRASNAVGDVYWYNTVSKEAVWTLPEENSTANDTSSEQYVTDASLVDFESEEGVSVTLIPDRTEWVKISRDNENVIYYFNVRSLTTTWNLPEASN